MKFDKSVLGAALALGLFTAAWSPAATAATESTPCTQLRDALEAYHESGGNTENPRKPKNVAATNPDGSDTFTVSWDIPSNRPLATVTKHSVHLEHEASGHFTAIVEQGSNTSADIDCPSEKSCTGTMLVKVRLWNNCDVAEEWSDAFSYERSE